MRLIALDTETELIARGRQVPPLVCLSWAELHLAGPLAGTIKASGLLHHSEALPFLLSLLDDPDVHVTGASLAYDVLVTSAVQPYPTPEGPTYHEQILAKWVAAYQVNRVTDVLVRQKLLDLAAGVYRRQQLSDGRWVHHRYNLAAVAQRMIGMSLNKASGKAKKRAGSGLTLAEQAAALKAAEKEDEETDQEDSDEGEKDWQLRYGELRDKPLHEWPEDARTYPLKDAEAPALIWWAQQEPGWRALQLRRQSAAVGHVMGAQGQGPSAVARPVEKLSPALSKLRAGGAPIVVRSAPVKPAAPAPSTHGPPQSVSLSTAAPTITVASDFLWRRIRENFGTDADPFKDQHRQVKGALWLRAMSSHGMVTDPEAVERFAARTTSKHAEVTERLVKEGLVRVEWHLKKEVLNNWVLDKSGTGVKKAELLNLLQRIPNDYREALLALIDWLPIVRVLRAGNKHEPGTLEWFEAEDNLRIAAERFASLEAVGVAHRTFHRDTKAAAKRMYEACQAEGIPVPRTGTYDPNKHTLVDCIALDKDACNSVQDEVLTDYSELSHLAKMLSADIPVLRSGAIAPIHTHFEELLETGRTGSSKPNVQNRARGEKCQVCRGKKCQVVCLHCMGTGAELGDRECFVPRPGWVMVDSDYSLGELHTLAQACLWLLGHSELAKALKEGKDPHTAMAGEILGISYEESVKLKKIKDGALDNARNAGKAVNFGKPGGLSAKTMRAYAVRTYGVDKTLEEWERILKIWERLWTEMPEFFRYIDKLPKRRGQASIERAKHEGKIQQLYSLVQPYSERLRAGATYCATCNSVYQGLLADVLKKAGWYIFCCSYLSSAIVSELLGAAISADGAGLYGCRPCNEIHDQFLIEAKEAQGVSAARSTGLLMNRAGAEVLPDVPVKCEPILTRRWSKRADLVRGEDGVMVAWEDPRLAVKVASVN